ncbi:MAG: phosphoglucosamine mutase, partial [Clostridia bacterium]
SGRLNGDKAVGTLHTNLGVELSLNKLGITLERTDIGDHFVMEKMLKDNLLVGGEQSGHIILREFSNTGDGVLAGVVIAKLIKTSGQSLHALNDCMRFPQTNLNITTANKTKIMEDKGVLALVEEIKTQLGADGRVMLRASGTEPKIRIMVEANQKETADTLATIIKDYITKNLL